MDIPSFSARLRWHCRRGMLELDRILGHFVARHVEDLNECEQALLLRLLEHSDQELYNWLVKRISLSDLPLQMLVNWIRHDSIFLFKTL